MLRCSGQEAAALCCRHVTEACPAPAILNLAPAEPLQHLGTPSPPRQAPCSAHGRPGIASASERATHPGSHGGVSRRQGVEAGGAALAAGQRGSSNAGGHGGRSGGGGSGGAEGALEGGQGRVVVDEAAAGAVRAGAGLRKGAADLQQQQRGGRGCKAMEQQGGAPGEGQRKVGSCNGAANPAGCAARRGTQAKQVGSETLQGAHATWAWPRIAAGIASTAAGAVPVGAKSAKGRLAASSGAYKLCHNDQGARPRCIKGRQSHRTTRSAAGMPMRTCMQRACRATLSGLQHKLWMATERACRHA
jgi:hypothetical protein